MTEVTTTPRWVRPRREDVLLGLLVAVFAVSVVIAGSLFLIARQYEPEGSLFGRPMRIPACGRSYRTGPSNTRVSTLAEIEARINPGFRPVVFEPVIGQIPLFSFLTGSRDLDGIRVCDTLVYLHVGPDAYASYGLEGGP